MCKHETQSHSNVAQGLYFDVLLKTIFGILAESKTF